ncbi:MAG: hypothetical protein ACHQDF_07140 [Chitinophagales bacterium]
MRKLFKKLNLIFFILPILISCKTKNRNISADEINAIGLKRGEIVLCSPAGQQFGSVSFDISGAEKVKTDFNLAISLLHSFEYDEAEKVFAKIIDEDPECAMAYWGVAMCSYHPLWEPPSQPELKKGAKAIEIAGSLERISEKESDFIGAIARYYKDWNRVDAHQRSIHFEKAMESVYKKYPGDREAAIFYALSLDAAADPADKTFANQRKAGSILNAIYPDEPNHPGILHYIIHTYDYPELAELALPAARKYASVAPSSAHAQHMPSHIFTRLGLWDECIKSNVASTSSAKCYAENAAIKGHWDEELHGLDYLIYAYLQKGDVALAKEQYDYLKTVNEVYPVDFKVAYAFAAIPARYLLENKMWKDAAGLEIHPAAFPWDKFPWQKAIIHFARLMGSVHTGEVDSARAELVKLKFLHDVVAEQKDTYKANQIEIQIKAAEAWMLFKERKNNEALELMNAAADMEDATQKSPVTPGEVIPARELLGDMLLQMGYAEKALEAYQEDLRRHPNRFNGLYGAGSAAEKSGDTGKAGFYYQQLSAISAPGSARSELAIAKLFLKKR